MQTESVATENRLSLKLRQATAQIHRQAEGAGFITNLFQGNVKPEAYYHYLWALHQMYEALETAMTESLGTQAVKMIHFEELERTSALVRDLEAWSAHETEIPDALIFEVHEYRKHLFGLAAENPVLLVAHAYVRYLGDLSGGQILKKILLRRYPDSTGLNFYDFDIADVAVMKDTYRAGLDIVGELHPRDVDALCDEAVAAFGFNNRIFRSLAPIDADLELK